MFLKYLYVFFISMIPLIELRGAIPVSQGFGLNVFLSYVIAIIGNMIPVPAIYFFAQKILRWGSTKKIIGKPCNFFLERGKKAGAKLQKKNELAVFFALLIFVGIPLPGTGAWTGTLAASILEIDFKCTVLAVWLGVLLAGIIMALLSVGIFRFL